MSGFVPVCGNISCQNGNMSTPTRTVIHTCKQMQSVAKLTSISRYWPSKSTGTSRYRAFATYIMQGTFTLLLSATVSTAETVKVDLFPHNMPVIVSDEPIHSTWLSCRISLSRPGSWSLFLCTFFQFQHVLIEVRHKQSILDDTVFFKFCLSMKLCNFCGHLTRIL